MKIVSCIICPNSCTMEIDEKTLEVSGNRCPRGLEFAKQELINPVRSVTSTVKTIYPHFPVLACRTSKPINKNKIMDVMKEINKITLDHYVKVGDVIIKNVADSGSDLIASDNILEEEK